MKKFITISFLLLSLFGFGQNSIKSAIVRDIARDWVIFTTTSDLTGPNPSATDFTINGSAAAEYVETNDTTFSIRNSSVFTQGQTVSVTWTTPGGGELGGLASFTSRGINNQIGSGTVHNWTTTGHTGIFQGVGVDFNTTYSISAGDIVVLAPGDYGSFDVSLMTGVKFVSQYSSSGDSVRFTYVNMREETINSGLFGHPAMPSKSIKIRNDRGNFGIGCFATGDIWFENLELYNVKQGIQVKTVSDLLFSPYNLSRLNYQNLVTKYISVHDINEEAFYIGSDVAAPLIPIRWTGFGLSVTDAGRDAYQYRNGTGVWLKNMTISNIGLEHNTSHAHGFLWGTTTQGTGWVENLTGTGIWGNGVLVNGYGVVTFKNVNLSSLANTVYIKNYDDHDEYNVRGLVVNFVCTDNEFDCTDDLGYSLDVRRDPAKTKITLNINNGTNFIGNKYVEDGVHGGTDNGIIYNTNSVCKNTGFIH